VDNSGLALFLRSEPGKLSFVLEVDLKDVLVATVKAERKKRFW
jgi:hypothetical protein